VAIKWGGSYSTLIYGTFCQIKLITELTYWQLVDGAVALPHYGQKNHYKNGMFAGSLMSLWATN